MSVNQVDLPFGDGLSFHDQVKASGSRCLSISEDESWVTQESEPTAIFLTSLPMKTLQRELHYICQAGPQIDQINSLISRLCGNPHQAALEAAYLSFRHALRTFTWAFDRVLMMVDLFYEPKFAVPSSSLQELVEELLDPENQRIAVNLAEDVVSRCNKAHLVLLDEVLPLLMALSNALKAFADTSVRIRIRRERQLRVRGRSIIPVPNILLDLVLKSTPANAAKWTTPEIATFLENFAQTRRTLERLPSLVQNFQGYFLRLSEIGKGGIDILGYTTVADIERLAEDRAMSLRCARMMLKDWLSMS